MVASDKLKWNDKWAAREFGTDHQSPIVELVTSYTDPPARLLDIAGGGSPASTELASAGFDVTVTDVSSVGLKMAHDTAVDAGVEITTLEVDLDNEPLPAGPWDVITVANFHKAEIYPAMIDALKPGGLLITLVATITNLERHERPSRPFLIEPGEIARLSADLEVLHHTEAWRSNDRHEAHLVARKPLA